jgi:anti-anti-sigma factor
MVEHHGGSVRTESASDEQAASSGFAGLLQVTDLGDGRVGLRVAGEIDLTSYRAWEQALGRVLGRPGDVHLDLAALRFIDARSTALLVRIAGMLADGQRLVLHHPPQCLRRVLETLWDGAVSTIVIEGDAA